MDETTLTQSTPPDMPSGGDMPSDGGTPPDMPSDSSGTEMGGGTPPDAPGGSSSSSSVTWSGATEITAGGTFANQTYTSTTADQNALLVNTSDAVAITNPTVQKTGDSNGGDNTSFYGTNAAIMVKSGSTTAITGGTVTTAANGANGIFCYGGNGAVNGAAGDGSTVYINGTTIVTTGNQSGGIMTTGGGVTAATNLNVTTNGNSSAAIRSDRGGGTVLVSGGSYTSNGVGSPAIYSTAEIAVENAVLTSTQSEGVCIEGLNSVALTNCTLNVNNVTKNGNAQFLDGVMIYQSMSGDSASGTSTFSMSGGTLNNYSGHAFHVTNTNAVINLSGVTINNASGILLSVCDDGWSGASNIATLNASGQALSGDILVGSDSGLTLNLTNGSTFTGNIGGTIYDANGNQISSAVGAVNLVLDSTSYLSLTGDTYLTGFTGDASNIITNGHNLYVNNQLYGGTTTTMDETTSTAISGLTFSADGTSVTVDSSYAGTGINLNDAPTVVNVDASNASEFGKDFTIYGNAQNNYIQGSYNAANTIWGSAGNNTLRAGAFLDTFIYTGGGNDVVYFTPNEDRLYLLTDITSIVSSGGNYLLTAPTGNTLTLVTGSNSDYNQIFYTTDGNLKTAQIGDMNSTAIPYMGADLTALSQPGTLVVWGNADETYTFEDGSTYTFEGSNYDIRLDGSTGKTFVNVYNVDASNSFGNDVIFGDANSNVIIEGGGNNILWGGAGSAADYLQGGTGEDTFLCSRNEGNDIIVNASIADSINLYDVTLSDIISATEVEGNGTGTISLTFSTGNTLTVQGTDSMSAAFNLADGSSWRYHRGTGTWQSA